ncbi:MAG: M23 family metallopeptidase [Alphaproteobacteria bacterium]|nr:M23 family metallopeptidase [Alphaproteobacteria bacterium]
MRRRRFAFLFALCCVIAGPAHAQDPFAEFQLTGVFDQGGYAIGQARPGDRLTVGERALRLTTDGRFLIGFHRDESSPFRFSLMRDGATTDYALPLKAREYAIQRIDGLPPKQVTPPAEVLARIRSEAEAAWIARDRDSALTDFEGRFDWPLQGDPGVITGVYGSQRILNGEPRQPHYGVDIAAPTGTPVLAPAGGVVSFIHEDMYFSGGTLMIDHGHGLASTFLHMETIEVALGDAVARGQRIGTLGASGRATGPHLDWRVNWFQSRLDPMHFASPE